jgi:hypothetical protein
MRTVAEPVPRSLLDFLVDSAGKANIIYTTGKEGPADPTTGLTTSDTDLFFTKEK